jgi:predicted metal-dependent HD superfamily phosphohydrolase
MELQNILNEYGIKCDVRLLLDKWNESHRYYHDLEHLTDLISQINEDFGNGNINQSERKKLIIAAIFHDIVYEPHSKNNEEKSAELFYKFCSEKHDIDVVEIKQIILDTKDHVPSTPLSKKFISYDMKICERSLEDLINWEKKIRKEYELVENKEYSFSRLNFLESLIDRYPNNIDNLLDLIQWVKHNY